MSGSVAILGTEGTGKTVLMTVWARAFQRGEKGISLIPRNVETSKFVARNWEYLCSGEWPPSTREGSLIQLRWELRFPQRPPTEVRFREIAGQDFRALFKKVSPASEPISNTHRQLLEDMQQAAACILLVNLADMVGTRDADNREENQWALKSALDWMKETSPDKPCLLLFTQVDKFRSYEEECGSWVRVAQKYLPYVYTSHLANRSAQVHAVSAVANTRTKFGPDGGVILVPTTKWHAKGLVSLTTWIAHCLEASPSSQPIFFPEDAESTDLPEVGQVASPPIDKETLPTATKQSPNDVKPVSPPPIAVIDPPLVDSSEKRNQIILICLAILTVVLLIVFFVVLLLGNSLGDGR